MNYILSIVLLMGGAYLYLSKLTNEIFICFGLLLLFLVLHIHNELKISMEESNHKSLMRFRQYIFYLVFITGFIYSAYLVYLIRWTYVLGDIDISYRYIFMLIVTLLISGGLIQKRF